MARGGAIGRYLSPSGDLISFDCYKNEFKDVTPDPYIVRKFENGVVSMVFERVRVLSPYVAMNAPREHWLLFNIHIENILTKDAEGEPLPQPKRTIDLDSKGFRTFEEAETYYNQFLAKYTASHFDEVTGEIVEVGNIFTPPDPDIPTAPTHKVAAEQFGSW